MKETTTTDQHQAIQAQQKNSRSRVISVAVIVGLLLAAGSFLGGVQYQKGRQPATKVRAVAAGPNAPGPRGQGGGFGGGRRGAFGGQRPTLGAVTAISPTSITVKGQDGSSVTLAISDTTKVNNNGQAGAISDIKVGDTVAVIANGTNASRILVDPSFGNGDSSNGGAATPPTTVQ